MKTSAIILAICLISAGVIMLAQNTKPQETQLHLVSLDKAIKVRYKNYRGEVAVRSIVPMEVYWGQTEYHPHDQWLLKVWDVEKDAERIYAFKDIQEFDIE